MESPFQFGSTVSRSSFTNRTSEIARLKSNLTSQINTILISPRRWGKSSLVEEVAYQLRQEKQKIKVVILDLYSIQNEQEFLTYYAREILNASTTKWTEFVDLAKSMFKKIIPKLSMSVAGGQFSIEFDDQEVLKNKDEILDLAEKIAQKTKSRYVICIDEFQNIIHIDKDLNLEKLLRSKWQRHKKAVYCLLGSKRHMMSDIFNDPSRPFYRFGDIILLQKISTTDWVSFIQKAFKKTGKKISSERAEQIASKMSNHSWYVQQFAHYTWLRTKTTVQQTTIDSALNEITQNHKPFFDQIIDSLSRTQIALLKSIHDGEYQLTSTAVMKKYDIGTPNNIRKNIITLSEKDIIDEMDGKYIFLDPVVELLFKDHFIKL